MMTLPDPAVLACPFCARPGLVGETLDFTWYAMCSDDQCVVIPRYFPTKAEALAMWNHRPLSVAVPFIPESTTLKDAA